MQKQNTSTSNFFQQIEKKSRVRTRITSLLNYFLMLHKIHTPFQQLKKNYFVSTFLEETLLFLNKM